MISVGVEATGENLVYQWYKDGVVIDGANLPKYTQPYATPEHNGTYHVVVTGDCGVVKSENALVQVDPSLEFTAVKPEPICDNEIVDLTTLISGVADGVTIRYFSDAALENELIGDARKVTVAGNNTYYVKSFDGRNDSAPQVIEIVGIVQPAITAQPVTSVNVSNGAAIKLSVEATGSNLTYQWYKGTELLTGETSNSLIIINATTSHNGQYKVAVIADCKTLESTVADVTVQPSLNFTVSNPAPICPTDIVDLTTLVAGLETGITVKYYADRAGVEELASTSVSPTETTTYYVVSSDGLTTSTPQMIVVEVKTATTITTNLVSSYRVSDGGTISLSVAAEGENLTYQWYKDGAVIAGATSATYVNENSTPANDGVYHVVVTGECGIVESVKATITVDPSLQFTASNYGSAVCPSTTIELTDQVTGVSAGVIVKYYQDANATIELTSTSVAPLVTTSYYVQASYQDILSPIQAIRVDVTPSTIIVTEPTSIGVSYEGAIVLRVEATGCNLTYQWMKDGVALAGETRSTYEKLGATPADNGDYTVVVSGDCGVVTSEVATVKVDPSLSFTVTNSNPICIGETLDLNTLITGVVSAADGVVVKFYTDAAATTELSSSVITAAETITYYAQSTDGVNKGEVQEFVVTVKPDVAVEALVDAKIVEKDAITLVAKATGLNLTYQWSKDGVELAGETRNVLEILNAATADSGTYKVVVSGECKSAETQAVITVYPSLDFTITPLAEAICPSDVVDLSSLVSGAATGVTIKYYADRAGVEELASPSVSPTETTTYYVIATNGLTVSPAQMIVVEVNTATAITANLVSSYRVSNGGTISLSVVAEGENLTYQWYKDGAVIAGATSATYVNENSTPANDGVYHVVVTGVCGEVTSVKATVKVDPSLQFTASNYGNSVCPATVIELTDQVTGVSAGVIVKYYQDANATIELTNTSVSPLVTTSYYVQASYQDILSPIQAIRVDVTPSTIIVTEPTSIGVSYEGAIVFRVEATGSNLTYQWSKDGVALAGETRSTYEKLGATPADNGDYTVVVSGDCGVVTSEVATVKVDPSLSFTVTNSNPICIGETLDLNTLITGIEGKEHGVTVKFYANEAATSELPSAIITATETITYYAQSTDGANKGEVQAVVVNVKPDVVIVKALTNLEIIETEAIHFEVEASGLNLTYQWYKDGVELIGETRKVLEVLNATKANEGTYKVVVTGDCKTVESTATVTVDDGLSIKTTNPAAICAGTAVNLANHVVFVNNPTNNATIKFYSDELATAEIAASVSPSVTTTYYVKATDALTETAVLKIVVTVSGQATATMTSGVDIVCANTEVDLTLALTGTAPWTVVYNDGTKDNTVSGITNANHTFKVMVAKPTTYTLKSVVDALGCINTNVTSSVAIDVHADVVITEQPQTLVFCLGNDVTLAVKAENAVSYQWYKDGVALANETGNVLEISDAVAADMGIYHVAVIGECKTVESNKVQVDGNILDIIVQKWNNTLVANNNPDNNGGYKFVSYKWYRDGELIGEGPYHTVGNDPTSTLVMGAAYHLEVTTVDGKVMVTCPYYPVLKDQLYVNVYPNMVSAGEEVNLEIRNGGEPVNNAVMEIYTVSGMHIKSMDVKESIVPLNLPYRSDLYLVRVKFDGYSKTFKVVVK